MFGEDNITALAGEIFGYLSEAFPVSCESDEFYFFPQLASDGARGPFWDDFSKERVESVVRALSGFETRIGRIASPGMELDESVDVRALSRLTRTLREQLEEVSFHTRQPTYHLTIVCEGIAKALRYDDPDIWEACVSGLPGSLQRAGDCLSSMPEHFRDLGVRMAGDITGWVGKLSERYRGLEKTAVALQEFREKLETGEEVKSYRLPPETVSAIYREHIGTGMDIYEIKLALEKEVEEMEDIMARCAERVIPGAGWEEVVSKMDPPGIPSGGILSLYLGESGRLLSHCEDKGLVPRALSAGFALDVKMVPGYLSAIRAASSYSFSPFRSDGECTFYVNPDEAVGPTGKRRTIEYRMLTAHETYPGHHLLDSSRWLLAGPVRRHVELPLFYEGWACFAEELMRVTGYFFTPEDQLLLAKRRYFRALRGMVDMAIQTGEMDISGAARFMSEWGFPGGSPLETAGKYALRPGYQLCYTIGLVKFIGLFERFGGEGPSSFCQKVLKTGEIGFSDLEKIVGV